MQEEENTNQSSTEGQPGNNDATPESSSIGLKKVEENYLLGDFWAKKVSSFLMVVGLILLVGSFFIATSSAGTSGHSSAMQDDLYLSASETAHHSPLARFFFSYLFSFSFFSAIAIGSVFFVVLQSLVRAGWSVVIRRIPEVYGLNIGLMAILAVPLLVFGMHDLYHWTDAEAVKSDVLLQAKEPYLNSAFFYIRVAFYFLLFFGTAWFYYKRSTAQDNDGDVKHTLTMQKFSPPFMIGFALGVTFFSFDFLMSLMPHWYSTVWGVYYFASGVVASLAIFILSFLFLRGVGLLKKEVTVEHYHDLGKLLFAFNVFWCYIAFSQYMLIWYANIPETTIFFLERINGTWKNVSILLLIGHGFIPILFYLSRNVKRSFVGQGIMCGLLVIMELVNAYWIVLPNIDKSGIHLSSMDTMLFLGMAGLFFGLFLRNLGKCSVLPKKDPRLAESLAFENA